MASALPNLNDTLGCTFIGILFEILWVLSARLLSEVWVLMGPRRPRRSCRFYGFSCAQTQYYFHEYPEDKAYLKILVLPVG